MILFESSMNNLDRMNWTSLKVGFRIYDVEIARIILYHQHPHVMFAKGPVGDPMVLPRPDMLKTEGLELIATTHAQNGYY